jgi:hypothetical protein
MMTGSPPECKECSGSSMLSLENIFEENALKPLIESNC